MATIKKALRTSLRRRRYSMFEQKENDYINTPNSKWRSSEEPERMRGASSEPETQTTKRRQSAMIRRGSQVRRSVRDAVGVIRQKFKSSTQRLAPLRENRVGSVSTPNRVTRRQSQRDVPMYSPFHIETPNRAGRVARRNQIRTVVSLETPTRLRREVEALTANMQALSALTPNTLQDRRRVSAARKSPCLTNGSLKTPRNARRRIDTNV